ncbi:MAG: hypothetical protein ABH833_02985 [Parcubacteria group bacterium]
MKETTKLQENATAWMQDEPILVTTLDKPYYCETRDVFQTRLDSLTSELLDNDQIPEDTAYLVSAIVGEIGNNSFDHNIGNWPDVIGIFFGYYLESDTKQIVLADRGRGVFTTLRKVKPDLLDDKEALEVAFTQRLSGRAPENRGNGLKFVKQSVSDQKLHLSFSSGSAEAILNTTIEIKEREKIRGCLAILSF